ncbi:MAG: immunity 26/phosphotriesterase HocA family protein [Caulobacterales bacterium]
MATIQTNLKHIKRSNRLPAAGDVFVMQLPTEQYLFGRVVLADPPRGSAPGPHCYLVYIFASCSDTKKPEYQQLRPDNLLILPVWTNRLGWTKGYFQTIENVPIQAGALLRQHCFRRHDGVYLDETGRRLTRRVEPCGLWGLASYRWIDDRVSDAVGIPRVPVDAESDGLRRR